LDSMKLRAIATAVLLVILTACNTTSYIPTPLPALPTYPALGMPYAPYWDMGVSVQYPQSWQVFYGAGQLLIARDAEATRANPPTEPLISLQYATLEQLGMDKTATLEQIAGRVSRASGNTRAISAGKAAFAGLDAFYTIIEETSSNLLQQAVAFRMPDGRIGWLIGLAPRETWPNFLLTLDGVRESAKLTRSPEYPAATFGVKTYFTQGDFTLTIPTGWVDQAVPNAPARLYHAQSDAAYVDGSGFANGAQLVVSAFPRVAATTIGEALGKSVGAPPNAKIDALTISGQPAAQYITIDPASGQQIIFTALEQPSRGALVIFRWTTPATLSQVARPTLDTILKQVEFGNKVR
jgi:hypothetical protein